MVYFYFFLSPRFVHYSSEYLFRKRTSLSVVQNAGSQRNMIFAPWKLTFLSSAAYVRASTHAILGRARELQLGLNFSRMRCEKWNAFVFTHAAAFPLQRFCLYSTKSTLHFQLLIASAEIQAIFAPIAAGIKNR